MHYQDGILKTHNGKVTITSPTTGEHRTFSVRTQPADARFAPGKRVVALLNGPDNQSDYTGFGFVQPDGRISIWRKKRASKLFQAYARMLTAPSRYIAQGAEYLFSERCRRCNRELTHPESIKSGLGPICRGIV